MPDENERKRKERVIHTRVSETLDEELRRRAAGLGVSVSNLVRNALLNAFGLVEDVISDSASVARSARGEGAGDARVLGWQALTLELNALCERCNAILPRGSEAAIAVTDRPAEPQFRCVRCTKEAADDRPGA